MGLGIVRSNLGDGRYTVEAVLDQARLDEQLDTLASELAALDPLIVEARSDLDGLTESDGEAYWRARHRLDRLLARKASARASIRRLGNWKVSPPLLDAWCADLTADLGVGTQVATVEVPGQRGVIQIRPAFSDRAAYDPTRDGRLQPAAAGTPFGTYFNWALLPAWLKWRPFARVGTLSAVDHDADTGTVALDPATAARALATIPINPTDTLSDIPINYMDCNARPFEAGDRVLVDFPDRTWTSARIVGFESAPKPCFSDAWETWDGGLHGLHEWNLHVYDWPGTAQTSGLNPQPIDYYIRRMYYPFAYGGGYYRESTNGVYHRYVLPDPDVGHAHTVDAGILKYRPQSGLSAEKQLTTSDYPWGAGNSSLDLSWRASAGDPAVNPLETPWMSVDIPRLILQKAFQSWKYYATDPAFFSLHILLAEEILYWQWDGADESATPTGDFRDWDVPEGARFVDFTILDDDSGSRFESGTDLFGSPYVRGFAHPDQYFIMPGHQRRNPDEVLIPYDPLVSWREEYGPVYSDFAASRNASRPYVWPEKAKAEMEHIRSPRNQHIGPFKTVFDLRDYCTWPIGGIVVYALSSMGIFNLIFELDTIDFTSTIPMPHLTPEQADLFRLHNEHRGGMGLYAFRWDVRLEAAAKRHADDIAAHLLESHYGSDGSGPVERIRDAGYFRGDESMWQAYENIAYYPIDAPLTDVFQGWLDSPPHRGTIEMPILQDIGISSADAADGRRYWVACFGAVSG